MKLLKHLIIYGLTPILIWMLRSIWVAEPILRSWITIAIIFLILGTINVIFVDPDFKSDRQFIIEVFTRIKLAIIVLLRGMI